MNSEHIFAFFDIETTGLDEKNNSILEIACVLTDMRLNEIAIFETLVEPKQEHLDNMGEVVRDMHTKNGLLRCLKGGASTIEEASKDFVDFLQRYNNGDSRKIIFAGNSIGSLDLPFLREHMPEVLKCVHYRTLDVTSVRIATISHFGEDIFFIKTNGKAGGHRALADTRECIEEFRFMKKELFKDADS